MRTIRRDLLKRMAQAGELLLVSSRQYDDNDGATGHKANQAPMPVEVGPRGHGWNTPGKCCLTDDDFASSSGSAWVDDDDQGLATLYLHSNCSFKFRRKDGQPFATGRTTRAARAQTPHNKAMQAFLEAHGIDCTPKRMLEGGHRGCWRLYNPLLTWNEELRAKLTALGFKNWDGDELTIYSGNGGAFQVFVRGHDEFMNADQFPKLEIVPMVTMPAV